MRNKTSMKATIRTFTGRVKVMDILAKRKEGTKGGNAGSETREVSRAGGETVSGKEVSVGNKTREGVNAGGETVGGGKVLETREEGNSGGETGIGEKSLVGKECCGAKVKRTRLVLEGGTVMLEES